MDPKLRSILEDTKGRTITVLSCLINVQDALGYLPSDALAAVAEFTGQSINDVHGVATFYTHFRFEPPGDHVIEICWGPSCGIGGAQGLMTRVEEAIGVKFDSTSEDRKYTLRGLECAGACALAPVGKIDGKLIGRLTKVRLDQEVAGIIGNREAKN